MRGPVVLSSSVVGILTLGLSLTACEGDPTEPNPLTQRPTQVQPTTGPGAYFDIVVVEVYVQYTYNAQQDAMVEGLINGAAQGNFIAITAADAAFDPNNPDPDLLCSIVLPLDGAARPAPGLNPDEWYVVEWSPAAGAATTNCDGRLDPAVFGADVIASHVTPAPPGAFFAAMGQGIVDPAAPVVWGGGLGVPVVFGLPGPQPGVVDSIETLGLAIDEATNEVLLDVEGRPTFILKSEVDNGGAGLPSGIYSHFTQVLAPR